MGFMKFTKTALGNLIHKPATRLYPFEPAHYTPRTRGHISVSIDQCIFCGLCSRKCPTDAIHVDKTAKEWKIERFGCIQCGYCVESCPKKCLDMQSSYPEPAAQKYEETFTQTSAPVDAGQSAQQTTNEK